MRIYHQALIGFVVLASAVRSDEYKGAVVKGVQQGKFVFEVNGQEIRVSPGSIAWKAFDADGRQLTEFGHNFRVMKSGNVVDLITAKKRGTEYVQEIHLVKGQLAEVGKTKTTASGKGTKSKRDRPSLDQTTYTGATIKSVDGNKVVLTVEGKDLNVTASGSMKAFDTSGHKLTGKGQNLRILKEGNQVSVTTFKNQNIEVIREIHLVQGTLQEK
jgi:hypothetical protein